MNRTSEMEHILICLKEHIALSDDEDNLLLDYITNLQQENEAKEKVIIKQDYVINELEKWLINEMEKLHNISGDNFTTVGQSVYQEILDKLKELKEGK